MRKANQEITDQQIIAEVLNGSKICRIAMMDGDKPYLLPFNYGHADRCLYIHSAPAGKKIDLLRKNPSVCFEIEHTARLITKESACKWATLYRSVVGYGNVEIVTDFESKQRGLEIIMSQHGAPDLIDFEPNQVELMVILKIAINSITGKQSGNWDRETKS